MLIKFFYSFRNIIIILEYYKCVWLSVLRKKNERRKNKNTLSWSWHSAKSDGEVQVLEIWWVWSTLSLPILRVRADLGEVVPVEAPSIDQLDLLENN